MDKYENNCFPMYFRYKDESVCVYVCPAACRRTHTIYDKIKFLGTQWKHNK